MQTNISLKRISSHSNKVCSRKKNHKITHCMTLLKAKSQILQTFILRIFWGKLYQIALSQRISSKHFLCMIWSNWPRNVSFIPLCQGCRDEDSDYTLYAHCQSLIKTISMASLVIYLLYSFMSIRQNHNLDMKAMIWHDIVWVFLTIYQDFMMICGTWSQNCVFFW